MSAFEKAGQKTDKDDDDKSKMSEFVIMGAL